MNSHKYSGYRFLIYPTEAQVEKINITIGCARFVYNKLLDYRKSQYKKYSKSIRKEDCNYYISHELKKEYPWLKKADSSALIYASWHLQIAYDRFFQGISRYPTYHKKYSSKQSYTTQKSDKCNNIDIDYKKNMIKLPKVGWVKAAIHRELVGEIKTATVIKESTGKYYVSLNSKYEDDTVLLNTDDVQDITGVDLGIKTLATTDSGLKYDNNKYWDQSLTKLKREQRKLSRMEQGSNNWKKQKQKVARIYKRISNQREYCQHMISKDIVDNADMVVIEDLSVREMIKNATSKRVKQEISDAALYSLRHKIEYKSEKYGKICYKVDKYYPSSQICNNCGFQNKEIKDLKIREWTCPKCGQTHDRDVNAAINLKNEGIKWLNGDKQAV